MPDPNEKLNELLPILYKDMHAAGVFLGDTWKSHSKTFLKFLGGDIPSNAPVIDFGCGPTGGLAAGFNDLVIPHDPYVKKYSTSPFGMGARTLFSCDVLEHMTQEQLNELVDNIIGPRLHAPIQKVFLVISTRAANKTMPNGMNVHLTVQSPDWWKGYFDYTLGRTFTCTWAKSDMLKSEVVLGYVRTPKE